MFTLKDITLTIEPGKDVTRGTNVSLRCKATISHSEPGELRREYTIYKDNNLIYNKTSISEEIIYPLGQARVANSGKYRCEINIDDKPQRPSEAQKLTVSGWFVIVETVLSVVVLVIQLNWPCPDEVNRQSWVIKF